MVAENTSVVAQRAALAKSFSEGVDDGYDQAYGPLPEWFKKGYWLMIPYERGFIFGRELRLQEDVRDQA